MRLAPTSYMSLSWFLGSTLMGALYDAGYLIAYAVTLELLSVPFLLAVREWRSHS